MANILGPKSSVKFECKCCDYATSKQSQYDRHLLTSKHKRLTYPNENGQKGTIHSCHCGKIYKHLSSLCKHRKSCDYNDNNNTNREPSITKQQNTVDNTSLIVELLKQNQEFKDLIVEERREFQKIIIEMAGNAGNNTNCHNTNSNNKFNLNLFLNETCKDAIAMNDFIQNLEVTVEDFINTGDVGFVNGISKVMVERMREMDLHTRPMHCTDLKRETIYVKDAEKWEKDEDKRVLRSAVKSVANKNYKQLQEWYDNSKPEVEQLGTEECENYFKYYKAALGGYGKDEDKKFEDKIMRNVMKEAIIDKNTMTE